MANDVRFNILIVKVVHWWLRNTFIRIALVSWNLLIVAFEVICRQKTINYAVTIATAIIKIAILNIILQLRNHLIRWQIVIIFTLIGILAANTTVKLLINREIIIHLEKENKRFEIYQQQLVKSKLN